MTLAEQFDYRQARRYHGYPFSQCRAQGYTLCSPTQDPGKDHIQQYIQAIEQQQQQVATLAKADQGPHVADDCCIYQSQQGGGGIGEDNWPGTSPDGEIARGPL